MPASDVPAAITEWAARKPSLEMLRDYRDGKHRHPFASPKFAQRYKWVLRSAKQNLMPGVVTGFTAKIGVESWGDDAADQLAKDLGLARLLAMVQREKFTCGDSYAVVWRNAAGQARPVFKRADDIVPHVDPENPDVLDWAAYVFTDSGYGRVNIYYPDRCERFVTRLPLVDGANRKLRDMPDQEIAWKPLDEGDTLAHDFDGVPVLWWKRDAVDQFAHGKSILEDAIPVQDELNYYVACSLVGVERVARPIRYALAERVPDGKVSFDPTRDDILSLVANSAGEFPGPNVEAISKLRADAVDAVAQVVGLPPYLFQPDLGNVPSGAALRTLNESRIDKIVASNRDDAPVHAGLMKLLGHEVQPSFLDAFALSDQERLDNATVEHDLGMPSSLWLRTAGYDPDQQVEGGRLVDVVDATKQATASGLGSALRLGQVDGTFGS